MSVALIISETLDGSAVADSLQGGGNGVDLGPVSNNSYAPLTSKVGNTGWEDLYIQTDATVDPVTSVKTFVQQYGVGTGFTYGGNASAAADYASLKSLGNASGSSKNNSDGLSGGLWIDMDWDAATANKFDQANFPTVVKIYGDNLTDGTTLVTAFTVKSAAMVYNNTGVETAAGSPVDGSIGKSGDVTLGDAAHVALRIYLPDSHTTGGYMQFEWVTVFSYTA